MSVTYFSVMSPKTKISLVLLVFSLNLFLLVSSSMGQDTLAFYNFDDGNTSIFTTGATGLNWTSDGRCSWEIGEPSGGRGYSNLRGQKGFIGNPDPTNDFSTDNTINFVAGQGLSPDSKKEGISGHYNNSNEWFQLPAINCTDYFNVTLSFWQWGNFEPSYDFPFLEISNDGINWNIIYSPSTLENTNWEFITLDISNYANDQSQVLVRWRTESDGSIFYAGWNLDNILVTGNYNNNNSDSYISLGTLTPPGIVSSLSDSYPERISIAEFSITDAGSGDNQPTIIDSLIIVQNEFNTIPNWKKAVAGISIYNTDNNIEHIGTIESDRFVFVNPSMFTINDGTTKNYILRLYLNKDLSKITDNDRLGITLNYANFSMNLAGSMIGLGNFSTNNSHLQIDIAGTQLVFISDPEQLVDVDRVLTPFVQVAATDENGNIDTDYSGTITISNTLGLATSNNTKVAVEGIALFNTLFFSESGGPTVLGAEATSLTNGTSQVSVTIGQSVSSIIFEDNFDNSGITGWTSGAITGSSSWETGQPNGGQGYSDLRGQRGYIGNPDPVNDHSSNSTNKVYGQGLSGTSRTQGISAYYNNSNEWLMSPAINCTDYYNTQLSFWRWANTELNYDKAYLEISTDGIQWVNLEHELYPQDQSWTYQSFDISYYADRQDSVYIRWRLESDGSIYYAGWNIDDVTISGIYSPVTTWTGTYSNNWDDMQNWSSNTVPYNFTSVIIEANTPYNPIISTPGAICKEVNIRESASLEITIDGTLEVFGNITIETNATGYGSLYDNGGMIVHGKGIMSRHISGGMWQYISSPIKNNSTNIFGSNIYKYNEPLGSDNWLNGWEQALNETIQTGIGYDVKKNIDSEIRMEGEFNTGDIIIDLTNTNGSEIPEHEGWNLVGNPYPSAIDWDAPTGWTKTNISNAIYIWDKKLQNFVTYVGGVGANGGTNLIPPMQGFFVKVSNPGTGQLIMTNEIRNNSTSTTLKAGGNFSNELKIKLSGNSYSDEAVVRLKHSALQSFDMELDAEKKFSPNNEVPQIYTYGQETAPLAINSLPDNNEYYQIKLYTTFTKAGEYTLNIGGIYDFDYTKTLYLEDLATEEIISIDDIQSYTFSSAPANDSARFILHINMPLSVNYKVKHVSAGQTNDGAIDLTILGGSRPILDIKWSNGSTVEDLENLEPGIYTILITDFNNNTIKETITVQQKASDGSLVSLNTSDENYIIVYENNGYILVDNPLGLTINKTDIFDLSGKLIYSDNNIYTSSFSIPEYYNTGMYIVNLTSKENLFSKKVVINH